MTDTIYTNSFNNFVSKSLTRTGKLGITGVVENTMRSRQLKGSLKT